MELQLRVARGVGMDAGKYSIEEVCGRGERIYEERIKALVELQENGRFIVIDIESGDYEIADDSLAAEDRLQERRPDAVTPWGSWVGWAMSLPAIWAGEGGYKSGSGD